MFFFLCHGHRTSPLLVRIYQQTCGVRAGVNHAVCHQYWHKQSRNNNQRCSHMAPLGGRFIHYSLQAGK